MRILCSGKWQCTFWIPSDSWAQTVHTFTHHIYTQSAVSTHCINIRLYTYSVYVYTCIYVCTHVGVSTGRLRMQVLHHHTVTRRSLLPLLPEEHKAHTLAACTTTYIVHVLHCYSIRVAHVACMVHGRSSITCNQRRNCAWNYKSMNVFYTHVYTCACTSWRFQVD